MRLITTNEQLKEKNAYLMNRVGNKKFTNIKKTNLKSEKQIANENLSREIQIIKNDKIILTREKKELKETNKKLISEIEQLKKYQKNFISKNKSNELNEDQIICIN